MRELQTQAGDEPLDLRRGPPLQAHRGFASRLRMGPSISRTPTSPLLVDELRSAYMIATMTLIGQFIIGSMLTMLAYINDIEDWPVTELVIALGSLVWMALTLQRARHEWAAGASLLMFIISAPVFALMYLHQFKWTTPDVTYWPHIVGFAIAWTFGISAPFSRRS